MQSLRQGLSAERLSDRALHQSSAFEDHLDLFASRLGLLRQLRPRPGRRRVRRMHGHEQTYPDEEVLRDGLRLPGNDDISSTLEDVNVRQWLCKKETLYIYKDL